MAMDGDSQEVVTLTPEEDAEADAAFNSGYDATLADNGGASGAVLENDASGKPLVTEPGDGDDTEEDPAAKAAAEEAARLAAEEEARAAAEAEANAPATLSKAELDALRAAAALVPQLQQELVRTRDTTAGKIGSLKQTLDAVQAAAAKGQAPTARQLTRLKAEFPELAELLQADLADPGETVDAPGAGGASGDAPGAAPNQVDPPAQVDPMSDPRVVHTLRQQSQQIVDAVHPDWKDLARSPEFNEWRTNLPPAAQQLLASSWDANVLVPAFKDFKTWRDDRAAKASAQADASSKRNKRLEHATQATNGRTPGANAVDDDEAFASGFKSVRR